MAHPVSSQLGGLHAQLGSFQLGSVSPGTASCAKFKLYSNSMIEFIGFGEDQIQSFNLVQIDEEMMLPVTEPRVGMWNLSAAGETEG